MISIICMVIKCNINKYAIAKKPEGLVLKLVYRVSSNLPAHARIARVLTCTEVLNQIRIQKYNKNHR